MANLLADAIMDRIRGVVGEGEGIRRQVPGGRFVDALHEGLSEAAEQIRGLGSAKPFVVRCVSLGRNASSPPVNGGLRYFDAVFEVVVKRTVGRGAQLAQPVSRAVMQSLEAEAMVDADILAQALEFPGNLSETSGSATTDLMGGMLRYQGTVNQVVGPIDAAQVFESTHTFSGILISRPA